MKEFEYREHRGYCRLCEESSFQKDIVCEGCINHLKEHIDKEKQGETKR